MTISATSQSSESSTSPHLHFYHLESGSFPINTSFKVEQHFHISKLVCTVDYTHIQNILMEKKNGSGSNCKNIICKLYLGSIKFFLKKEVFPHFRWDRRECSGVCKTLFERHIFGGVSGFVFFFFFGLGSSNILV